MKRTYEVVAAGEIAGRWRNAGDRIEMTHTEAKYLVPPLGANLIPADEKRKADHGKLDGNKRQRRNGPGGLGARPAVDRQDPDDAAGQPGDAT